MNQLPVASKSGQFQKALATTYSLIYRHLWNFDPRL